MKEDTMRLVLVASLAAGMALLIAVPAMAATGKGQLFHDGTVVGPVVTGRRRNVGWRKQLRYWLLLPSAVPELRLPRRRMHYERRHLRLTRRATARSSSTVAAECSISSHVIAATAA